MLIAILIVLLGSVVVGAFISDRQKLEQKDPASETTATTTVSSIQSSTTITSASVPTFDRTVAENEIPVKGMTLTFNEEFNELSLYTDGKGNITCEEGGVGRWQTVFHFCSRTIFSNYENEVYIDPIFLDYLNSKAPVPTAAKDSLSVSSGILTIEAKPADEILMKAVGPWAKYTSGLITTQFSFSQQYGYFEMRARVPTGKGVWPAFWLLPIDKSWPPEVDVMETFGDPNSRGEGGRTEVHYATHSTVKSEACGEWYDAGVDITEGFHTYGAFIEATGVTYYFDGTERGTCPVITALDQPFYMLVNLAVGSDRSWPTAPNASTTWPARMYVDYVRAYQKN